MRKRTSQIKWRHQSSTRPRAEALETRRLLTHPISYQHETQLHLNGEPGGVITADFDGDGKIDLATVGTATLSDPTPQLFVAMGDGHAGFGTPAVYGNLEPSHTNGTGLIFTTTADFNGDGHPDLAFGSYDKSTVRIFLWNTSSHQFVNSASYQLPGALNSITAGRFDTSGAYDIAVSDYLGGKIWLLRNSGTGTFVQNSAPYTGGNPTLLQASPLAGGSSDYLIYQDYSGGPSIQVLSPSLASSGFTASQTISLPEYPNSEIVADFNTDGRPDVLTIGSTPRILVNNGIGTLGSPTAVSGLGSISGASATDLDGDGTMDLVIPHSVGSDSGNLLLYTNPGSGQSFSFVRSLPLGGAPAVVATADINNDGIPDFETTAYSGVIYTPIALVTSGTPLAADTIGVLDTTVQAGNTAIAHFTVTRSGDLTGAASFDYSTADGTALAYQDYFPTNGTATFPANQSTTTVDVQLITPQSMQPGNLTFTLTISNPTFVNIDPAHATGTATITPGDIPTANTVNITVVAGIPTLIPIGASVSDPAGEALTVEPINGFIQPDGSMVTFSGTVSLNTGGTPNNQAGYLVYQSNNPNLSSDQSDNFQYQVTNTDGNTAQNTVFVHIVPRSGSAPFSQFVSVNTPVNQSVGIYLTNVQFQMQNEKIVPFTTNQTSQGGTITFDDNGYASDDFLRSDYVVYTPPSNFVGSDSFSYTISNSFGTATGTIFINVNGPNGSPPVAQNVSASTSPQNAVTIMPSASSSNGATHVLPLASHFTAAGNRVQIVSDFSGETFKFLPKAGFVGTDSFTYQVTDGYGVSNTATVTVTVQSQPIQLLDPDLGAGTLPGNPVQIDVLAHASDPNGVYPTIVPFAGGSLTAAHGGTVTIVSGPFGQQVLQYNPPSGWGPGSTDSFNYQVTDSVGQTATGAVHVGYDHGPTAANLTVNVTGQTTTPIDVIAAATAGDVPVVGAALDFVQYPQNGYVSYTYPNASSGDYNYIILNYVPYNNAMLTDSFTYIVRDALNVTSEGTITIHQTYAPPAAPTVVSAVFNDLHSQEILMNFSTDVSASVQNTDLQITPADAGPTPPTYYPDSVSAFGSTAIFNTSLPDGNYNAKLLAGSVDDGSQSLAADYTFPFFVLTADANHDRYVNTLDFNALATNYGQPAMSSEEGNFDHMGGVDSADFDLLAARFGMYLAPPATPGATADAVRARPASSLAVQTSSLFGDQPVSLLNDLLD